MEAIFLLHVPVQGNDLDPQPHTTHYLYWVRL